MGAGSVYHDGDQGDGAAHRHARRARVHGQDRRGGSTSRSRRSSAASRTPLKLARRPGPAPFAALASTSTVFFAVAKLFAKRIMTKEMKAAQPRRRQHLLGAHAARPPSSRAVAAADGAAAWASLAAADAGAAAAARAAALRALLLRVQRVRLLRLDALGAVSQAVANSAKRVVVLFVYFFEAASTQKLVGAGVAILGVLCTRSPRWRPRSAPPPRRSEIDGARRAL